MPTKKDKRKKEKDLEKKLETLIEEKIEKAIDKKLSKFSASTVSMKIAGELIGYLLFIFLAFRIFPRLSFITPKYYLWLPIGFRMTTLSTFLKVGKHSSNMNVVKKILEIGSLFASLYSTYVLLKVYPFNFTSVGWQQLDSIFPLALKIAILAVIIGITVNFIQIFLPEKKK